MEHAKKELHLVQDDNLGVVVDKKEFTEEQLKEFEELKKKYGIKE